MELECFKYKEKMKAEDAVCKHPGDYCKYRSSCMIQFICSEKKESTTSQDKGRDQMQKKIKTSKVR